MSYQLSIDTGKQGSRQVTRRGSSSDVAAIVADDGNTRIEVEARPDGGAYVTLTRKRVQWVSQDHAIYETLPNEVVTIWVPSDGLTNLTIKGVV